MAVTETSAANDGQSLNASTQLNSISSSRR